MVDDLTFVLTDVIRIRFKRVTPVCGVTTYPHAVRDQNHMSLIVFEVEFRSRFFPQVIVSRQKTFTIPAKWE